MSVKKHCCCGKCPLILGRGIVILSVIAAAVYLVKQARSEWYY